MKSFIYKDIDGNWVTSLGFLVFSWASGTIGGLIMGWGLRGGN